MKEHPTGGLVHSCQGGNKPTKYLTNSSVERGQAARGDSHYSYMYLCLSIQSYYVKTILQKTKKVHVSIERFPLQEKHLPLVVIIQQQVPHLWLLFPLRRTYARATLPEILHQVAHHRAKK